MPKNSIKGEWYANKEIVSSVLTSNSFRGGWSINFDELSRITNNHPEFLASVKEFAEKDLQFVDNAQVHRTIYIERDGQPEQEHISIVFDVCDIYIKIFSCTTDHEKYPYVFKESFNKSYVWSMSTML